MSVRASSSAARRAPAAVAPLQPLSPQVLSAGSQLPLYRQLALVLQERIRAGAHPPGAILPGEQELARLLNVSRITVKRALNDLASAGWVSRHRGRGTVVTFNAAAPVVRGNFENLLDSLRLMGLGTAVELREAADVPAPPDVADLLGLSSGAPTQRAVRLRKIEGEPFSWLVTYVPKAMAQKFAPHALAHRPLLELLEEAGHPAVEAEQWITAVAGAPEVASALGLAPGAPLLQITRVMRDAEGNGVEVLIGSYRPDRYQHHMKLARRRRGGRDEWR